MMTYGQETLCKLIKENTKGKYSVNMLKAVLRELFPVMANALIMGDRIEIRDFGNFRVYVTKARMGRHPFMGTPLRIPPRLKVKFFASRYLQTELDKRLKEGLK